MAASGVGELSDSANGRARESFSLRGTRIRATSRGVIEVDARGHRCPIPTLRLRRALEAAPAGALVVLLADDPLARVDVPHFAHERGLELVKVTTEGTTQRFELRLPV